MRRRRGVATMAGFPTNAHVAPKSVGVVCVLAAVFCTAAPAARTAARDTTPMTPLPDPLTYRRRSRLVARAGCCVEDDQPDHLRCHRITCVA